MKIDLKKEATNWGDHRPLTGGNPSTGAAEDGRKRVDPATGGGPLPQITSANGLAKQGFSATGNWFYRIGVFCGILHRKILDSSNLL
jgi:hypothetical protein